MDGLGQRSGGEVTMSVSTATVHRFQESLDFSGRYTDAPWWGIVYKEAFPTLLSMASVRADGWAQRGGIDRVLTLASGKTLWVDEKVREKDWPDILLEMWSDRDRRVPGWVAKDLACDYIAYAFVPNEQCYLLPFHTLRKAWQKHREEWVKSARQKKDGFRMVEAQNETYVTESVAVPIDLLLKALSEAMVIHWGNNK